MRMRTSKPLIAITMGDPCGIGPEIIIRALQNSAVHACCCRLYSATGALCSGLLPLVGADLELIILQNDELPESAPARSIFLKEITSLADSDMVYGHPTRASGDAVFRYITVAAALCMSGKAAAMVTAPINKAAMNLAGHKYPGHTELLAELTGTEDFVMMLAGKRLRVTLVTIHEAISAVPDLVTYDKVLSTIMITHRDIERFFCQSPRIAVLSLNPHAGEGEMFGDHEGRIILPAIEEARRRGVNATGPHSADTLFHFAARGDYDAVVCMYHDQGLIPLKLLHFDDGVNVTLGLPIIRTSVDHGTAYNIAGTGIASAESMKAAILTAALMANFSVSAGVEAGKS